MTLDKVDLLEVRLHDFFEEALQRMSLDEAECAIREALAVPVHRTIGSLGTGTVARFTVLDPKGDGE